MLLIGIAGGSGSGKTTVVNTIKHLLTPDTLSIISQDAYYKDLGYLSPEERAEVNFDHPDSVEFDLLLQHIEVLKQGQPIEMPVYSYITCTRLPQTIVVEPRPVIIVEGLLIFTNDKLRQLLDIKVFVDADSDDRLMRIIRRDIIERGRSVQQVMEHYEKWVKPMHQIFIEPTKRFADIIIPQGGMNHVAIDILAQCIIQKMKNQ